LHKIYRKLGVESRQQLVARLETLDGMPDPKVHER
jgi:DNA-binding CsgD family transcriptional regulator